MAKAPRLQPQKPMSWCDTGYYYCTGYYYYTQYTGYYCTGYYYYYTGCYYCTGYNYTTITTLPTTILATTSIDESFTRVESPVFRPLVGCRITNITTFLHVLGIPKHTPAWGKELLTKHPSNCSVIAIQSVCVFFQSPTAFTSLTVALNVSILVSLAPSPTTQLLNFVT